MQEKILLLICVLLLLFSCAHQIPPSGGADDKIGPIVLSSNPKTGATNIPVKARITIAFSEWLSTKSDRGVSVFPPLKVKVIVNRNHLVILPATAFADSTTYHITVNSQLQDLHNNPIVSPFSLIFSTGNSLDSGILSGCVIDPSRKILQPKVALFRNENMKNDSGFTGSPNYLIQTDSTGRFNFSNLKKGSYHAVAYIDTNFDNRIQPGKERIYIAQDSLTSVTSVTNQLFLFPAIYDTITPAIKTVKATSSTILSGQWTTKFDNRNGFNYPQCSVERTDTVSAPLQCQYIPLANNHVFTLLLKSPLKIAPYRLIYKITSLNKKPFIDTVLFNGISFKDTVKPVLQSWTPKSSTIDLDPTIKLVWSEPVNVNAPLFMIDSTGDTVVCKGQSGYSDSTTFILQKRLKPGCNYRIVILKTIGNDLAGNNLKARDSTDTAAIIKYKTINIDSLAISVQGGAACLQKSTHRKWIFRPINSNTSYTTQDSAGQFKFDSIPSGKGFIFYFEDLNENNKPDQGRLVPWIAPESYFGAPDTVEARARWEVEGIEVHICAQCEKKTAENNKP